MPENNLAEKYLGEKKRWSVMVYLAGGKDVSEEARESLLRMKQIGSTDNIHVIAQFDSGSEGAFTKRYYLSPYTGAMGIETLLRQACAEVPGTLPPYDSTAGTYYCQRLKETLTESQRVRMAKLQTGELIALLKHSPDRFKTFVLDCILDEDIYPRPSGNLGDTDAGDPRVLAEFVRWAKVRYPADHYMLVLWGHGAGLSVAWDCPSAPFIGPEDALTGGKLKQAFRNEGTDYRKEEEEFRKEDAEFQKAVEKYMPGIDIIGFNSCSLGTIEVSRQLRDFIKFSIASEGFTPKTSWPYDKILKALDENSEWKPEDFADKIVDEYIQYYEEPVRTAEELQKIELGAMRLGASLDMNTGWGQNISSQNPDPKKPSLDPGPIKPNVALGPIKPNVALGFLGKEIGGGVDLSVCSLKKTDGVTKAMKELVPLLLDKLSRRLDAGIFAAVLGAHSISQSYFNKDFTDLYDFCRALQSFCPDRSIRSGCQSVQDAIKVMCKKRGSAGSDVSNSYGISIFFPWGEWDKQEIIARYRDLDFIKETKWNTFLLTYRKLAHQFEARMGDFKAPK